MPNHVINCLEVIGEPKEVKAFVALVSHNKSDVFDFNKIISIPEELAGTNSPVEILSQEQIDQTKKKYSKFIKDNVRSKYSFGMTEEDSRRLIAKYGCNNWYDWNNFNWGTKWNAYEVSKWKFTNDGASVSFYTAWSPPLPLLRHTSKKFPNLIFNIKFAEEDSLFVGSFAVKDWTENNIVCDWNSIEGVKIRKHIIDYLKRENQVAKKLPKNDFKKSIKKRK